MSDLAPGNKSPRILSGIQPSGKLHLGNYFGAIKQHIELQDQGDCFYFIADFHALTSLQNAAQLRENVRDVAVTYLALGLDPEKVTLFKQSDVPEVTEITWLLSTVSGMGFLERAHSYKDKVARGISASVGLFTYPILMAADILAYQSSLVPVGQDQVQHVEMTQDMAAYFNNAYGDEVFARPEYRLDKVPKVPGTDGQKMSKSYGNVIEIFASGKPLKKSVMGIVTRSTPLEEPLDPEGCTVVELFKLVASPDDVKDLELRYREGGFGYGSAKKVLLERIDQYFEPYRNRREELLRDPGFVDSVLDAGARRAREEARRTLDRARRACGLV